MSRPLELCALLACCCVPGLAHAGPLDEVRSEVHGDSSSDDDSDDTSTDDGALGTWTDDDDDVDDSSPGVRARDPSSMPAYLPYPHAQGVDGYIVREQPAMLKRYGALRLHMEGAYQYDGLWRLGLGAAATLHWIELDSEWSWYRDTRLADELWIGDANLSLALVRRQFLMWHLGGGGRFLLDSKPAVPGESGHAFGWNLSTSLDLFPFDPLVFIVAADLGRLGSAWLWRARASVGAQLGPIELFAGYEHLQIGAARLGGPLLGFRVWL